MHIQKQTQINKINHLKEFVLLITNDHLNLSSLVSKYLIMERHYINIFM